MFIVLNGKKFPCELCGKLFGQQSYLINHIARHRNPSSELFYCSTCKKRFKTQDNLNLHIKALHMSSPGQKPYQCELCNKTFINITGLRSHQAVHEKDTPFCCNICKVQFKRKHSLERHQYVHKLVKDFICPLCGKAFVNDVYLRNHVRRHNN